MPSIQRCPSENGSLDDDSFVEELQRLGDALEDLGDDMGSADVVSSLTLLREAVLVLLDFVHDALVVLPGEEPSIIRPSQRPTIGP